MPLVPDHGLARAVRLVGDPWSPVLLREVAAGSHRFEALLRCGISRKVLSSRLGALVTDGVLLRHRYQQRPDRYGYHLTDQGWAFLPVLAALQEWAEVSPDLDRLVGTTVPDLDPDPLAADLMRGDVCRSCATARCCACARRRWWSAPTASSARRATASTPTASPRPWTAPARRRRSQRRARCMTWSPTRPWARESNASGTVPTIRNPRLCHSRTATVLVSTTALNWIAA